MSFFKNTINNAPLTNNVTLFLTLVIDMHISHDALFSEAANSVYITKSNLCIG